MALKTSKKTAKPAAKGTKAGKTTAKAPAKKATKAKSLAFKDISPFALKAMGEGRGVAFAEAPSVEGVEAIVSHLRSSLLKVGGLAKAKASTKVEKSAKASSAKTKAASKKTIKRKK